MNTHYVLSLCLVLLPTTAAFVRHCPATLGVTLFRVIKNYVKERRSQKDHKSHYQRLLVDSVGVITTGDNKRVLSFSHSASRIVCWPRELMRAQRAASRSRRPAIALTATDQPHYLHSNTNTEKRSTGKRAAFTKVFSINIV